MNEEKCPNCGAVHARGDYGPRPDLNGPSGGTVWVPPDVNCPCGAVLRLTVPVMKTNASGWVWKIVDLVMPGSNDGETD